MGQGWPPRRLQFTLGASVVTQAKGDVATLRSCCEVKCPILPVKSLAQLSLGETSRPACILSAHSHYGLGCRGCLGAPAAAGRLTGPTERIVMHPQGWPRNRVSPSPAPHRSSHRMPIFSAKARSPQHSRMAGHPPWKPATRRTCFPLAGEYARTMHPFKRKDHAFLLFFFHNYRLYRRVARIIQRIPRYPPPRSLGC